MSKTTIDTRIRADQLLVEKRLANSRAQAQRLIRDGCVSICFGQQTQLLKKPAEKLSRETEFRVLEHEHHKYVSRAGLKLEHALKKTGLDVRELLALDIGQSTGGFSDCLLQSGVAKVVGIEVGHGQLDSQLADHPQLICIEGVNARYLKPDDLIEHAPTGFDVAVMDVSFISQTLLHENIALLLRKGGTFISLIKPQFEVGRQGLSKGGIVKHPELFEQVKEKVMNSLMNHHLQIIDYFESPIQGSDGNREFLIIARKT